MARCQITSEKSSKNHISLFDGKPARGLPTPPPPPLPLPHIFHVLDGNCEPQVQDLLASITRRRGGGRCGWFAKRCHSITDHRINCKLKTKIASTILLLCYLYKICLTLIGGLWQASANLYSGGRLWKGAEASGQPLVDYTAFYRHFNILCGLNFISLGRLQ